ncbi:hypothetical protein [Desulfospira joergensenii]|uniref:hypothetical protein n=1 Tax=Desulfospira joergensenii TaxID=53329 RepID=UPI0003B409F9|nr:hypothetical protein [Desulfospira joergensenii]
MRHGAILLSFFLLFLTAGCAVHYHRVQGDTLVLYLKEPHAGRVALACSLDGFEPHEARLSKGQWIVSLPSRESFRYYYILDKKVFIPSCPMKEKDDFGSENCIYDPEI